MIGKVRWGIIGTGYIAEKFAQGLAVLPDAELVAIGSRAKASADAFADRFDIPNRYGSYEALVEDLAVDVVYIGTPHSLHHENSLLCLQAGKAVLCEKPFTINAAEAEEVINLSREKGLFLMEAMWTRFLPLISKVRELVADDIIGPLQLLTADLGYRKEFEPAHRLFDPNLGGGALLDLGIYPVSLASMVFGTPVRVTSMAHLGQSGVDEQAGIVLGSDKGQLAVLNISTRTTTPHEATLMGTKGRIRIHTHWHSPTKLTLFASDQEEQVIEVPFTGNGYNYQATEVANCLRSGKLESEIMPLDETLSIMQTLDEIRAQWGLRYPME